MGELFGTDGIRGVANRYPMDVETAVKVGRAVAHFFSNGASDNGRFVIGQDTRISGDMLASALAAGICSMGKEVYLAGVIPTPGVAHLTAAEGFAAGIVVSASHNPYTDNGIKLFGADGCKLSDADEDTIEQLITEPGELDMEGRGIARTGRVHALKGGRQRYGAFLKTAMRESVSLAGMKLVIDCANGAASVMARTLFGELGADVIALFCDPDGININVDCGSQHPQMLARRVVAEKADLGLAFDGDADRLIAVDESGTVLSGDQIMAICASYLKQQGELDNLTVVTTVMSNMGFGMAMKKMGLRHIKTKVGDRYVAAAMRETGAVLGGEDSGHMIFAKHHSTGDGMLAAIKLMEAVQSSGERLSTLASVMTTYPQCLINVSVKSKPQLETLATVSAAIEKAERILGEDGRVLVRYSGTQPQCRVMVEGPTEKETQQLCRQIADAVTHELG